ncbi:MAG: hypothetical protein KAT05_07515 [Spirochaetes bacterium]|nr:hypothetical protein [Spirochaetota bacterium]
MNNTSINEQRGTSQRKWCKGFRIVGMTIVGIIFAVLFAFVFGYFVMLLWNWLMPLIFGIKTITYWQAFGIVILAKILFGSFGPGHGKPQPDHIHRKVDEKWHKFIGLHGDHEYYHNKTFTNSKNFDKFWQDQGKAAFDEYVDKMQKESTE